MKINILIGYLVLLITLILSNYINIPVSVHLIIDAVTCIYIGCYQSLKREIV